MDRRLFLTGLLGVAGAAAVATVVRPTPAMAAPLRPGVLDLLDEPVDDAMAQDGDAKVEKVWHRHWHRPRRRRRIWRRVCRRYWRNGRWRTRCTRQRVWVFF